MIFNHAQEADYEKAYITKVHFLICTGLFLLKKQLAKNKTMGQ